MTLILTEDKVFKTNYYKKIKKYKKINKDCFLITFRRTKIKALNNKLSIEKRKETCFAKMIKKIDDVIFVEICEVSEC